MGVGPLLAVAAVVSVLGPAILLLALGTPLRRGALIRAFFELAASVALPSITAGVLVLLVSSSWEHAPQVSAVATAVTAFVLMALTYLRFRPLTLVRSSITRLGIPGQQTEAVTRLVIGLEKLRPDLSPDRPYRGNYPDVVLGASTHLIAHGFFHAAERICAALPEPWLTPTQSAQRANNLAVSRMRLGDVTGARAALELARGAPSPQEESVLCSSKAMLLLLEDKPKDALALLDERPPSSPLARMTVLVVRAHAHAALGELDRAQAAIQEIVTTQGAAALDALIHPEGPATALAIEARRTSSEE